MLSDTFVARVRCKSELKMRFFGFYIFGELERKDLLKYQMMKNDPYGVSSIYHPACSMKYAPCMYLRCFTQKSLVQAAEEDLDKSRKLMSNLFDALLVSVFQSVRRVRWPNGRITRCIVHKTDPTCHQLCNLKLSLISSAQIHMILRFIVDGESTPFCVVHKEKMEVSLTDFTWANISFGND